MARSGIYRTEIEKARNSLLAQGKNPSIDAVRVALGNTGSKTTIHRYLKELEQESTEGLEGKVAVSDALQDLIGRLATQLHEEAQAEIDEAKARFEAETQRQTIALSQSRQEATALSDQVQRLETALQTERLELADTRQQLANAGLLTTQLQERVVGLQQRVTENEAHVQSLEQKHQHARDALEHYRNSVKEQRDQDQRRHEHQVQTLQVEFRAAADAIVAKNQELVQLNRDNGRLTEQVGQIDAERHQLRADVRDRDREIQALRPAAADQKLLQSRCAQAESRVADLTAEGAALRDELRRESKARQQSENAAAQATARSATFEEFFSKLTPAKVEKTSPDI